MERDRQEFEQNFNINQEKKSYSKEYVNELYSLNMFELISRARKIHEQNWNSNEIQISTLCSIKTGSCPENCSYCTQSAHYNTGLEKKPIMEKDLIIEAAKKAKSMGASRFCMGAAWRGPTDKQLDYVSDVVSEVKKLGLETCVTLGLLKDGHAEKLKDAGLDYYNHNIDTSPEYYDKIITTRVFEDRLDTLQKVRDAGINVCCGGILGMGEGVVDRLEMLRILANMTPQPESVPINKLIKIKGTPLEKEDDVDSIEFVKMIAIARILMPKSYVRLAAGREGSTEEFQAMCFYAGANSIFYGETLLTADNPIPEKDDKLFQKLGLKKV
jgi:biotin synthase